jgi:hypothetical protein
VRHERHGHHRRCHQDRAEAPGWTTWWHDHARQTLICRRHRRSACRYPRAGKGELRLIMKDGRAFKNEMGVRQLAAV